MLRVALDEDRSQSKIFAKLDIGERIADDQTRRRFDLREIGLSLLKHPRERLAAGALPLIMRTEVEPIHMRAEFVQNLLKLHMDRIHIRSRIQPEGHAALVGYDDHPQSRLVQFGDRFWHAGQQMEVLPARHILAFWHFPVDDTVAIQEHSAVLGQFQGIQFWGIWQSAHPVMITMSLLET